MTKEEEISLLEKLKESDNFGQYFSQDIDIMVENIRNDKRITEDVPSTTEGFAQKLIKGCGGDIPSEVEIVLDNYIGKRFIIIEKHKQGWGLDDDEIDYLIDNLRDTN